MKLMEKSLAVAESTSEHIKSLNAEVALDASIKRKEKSIIILKRKCEETLDDNELIEMRNKLKKAEDEYELLVFL